MKKSEVIKVKKVLAVLSLFLGVAVNAYSVDQVCINGGGCADGVDQVISQSTPVFTAIAFVDGTTQTTKATGSGGGSATALLKFSAGTGSPYTTISSMTIVSPINGPLVNIGASSATVDLSSVAMTLATQTFSGGLTLTNPTTIQTSLQSPSLRILSANAYPIPLLIGNSVAGTLTGIGFQNGSISTNAYIGYSGNTETMFFSVKGNAGKPTDWLTYVATASGGVGINNISPKAVLHVSSGPGTTPGATALFKVSTGTFDIFTVRGDSVVVNVPLISMAGVAYPTSTVGGSGGGGGGNNGFDLFIATLPTNAVRVGSMTSVGTITSTAGFVGGGSTFTAITVGDGAGSSFLQGVGGPLNILGDMAFATTWYTSVSLPTFCGTSTMTVVNTSTPTNGLAWMDGVATGSAPFSAAFYIKKIERNYFSGSTPTISNFTDYSSGTVTGSRVYLVSFATASDATTAKDLVYTSTVVYVVSGNVGVHGGAVTTKTRLPLPGVTNLLGLGECVLWIRIGRAGNTQTDTANSNSAPVSVGLEIKVQQ